MKRIFRYLSAVAVLGSIACGTTVNAQAPAPAGAPPANASAQPMRPRIALVNIAKVLREFQKANADGMAITKKRQEYVDKVKPLREALATKSRLVQQTIVPAEKEKLQKELVELNRQIEDIDRDAQQVLGELTDKTIVDVYQSIKATINDIAVTNNLDLVMCYPDASNPEDEKKPAVAQLKLQTPALIPFYHRGMDITQVVVDTLNRRHPAPPVAANNPATPPARPMGPMGGSVTPVGGSGTVPSAPKK